MIGDHKIVVLQFSGGRDSLATLHYMRPWWDRIIVLWTNTGDAFPETIAQMQQIKAMVPNFVEANSDQPSQNARSGYPSDLVPVWDTDIGRLYHTGRMYKMQSAMACCNENIWIPMDKASRMLGATMVIRGQRDSETIKSSIRSGHEEGGITYLFPIQDWTREQVHDFLLKEGVPVPGNYDTMNTSLDCQHCTAYLAENRGKFTYMRERHAPLYFENIRRLQYNMNAQRVEMSHALAIIDESAG